MNSGRVLVVGAVALFALASCGEAIPKKLESDFVMQSDSLSFANFAAGHEASQMDAELMQRMFGDAVCKKQSSPCELTLGAKAFMAKANKAMTGGRCEGFAVTAALMSMGKLDATQFGGTSARDLALGDNTALQREIAYWFSTQLHPTVAERTKGYMAKDVMPKLVEALKKGATERYRIGIVKKQGEKITGGHAVTPIAFYADPQSEGVYLLRVYDNNLPDAERTMRIDTKNNRWEYEAAENPSKKSSLYYGDDSNQNPLYLSPIVFRTETLSCPFCDGSQTQVVSSGGAQISVSAGGSTSGVSNGQVSASSGSSVTPRLSATNDEEGAGYIVNVNGTDVSVSIQPGDDGSSTDAEQASVGIQGPGFSAEVSGLALSDVDAFAVSGGGRTVSYENHSRTDLNLASSVLVNDREVTVTATLTGGSDQVETSVDGQGVVVVESKGSKGTAVVVTLTVETADGGTSTGTLTYTSEGDSALGANAQQFAMTGTLEGTVNNDGMMAPLTNACEDDQRSGTESDVDCGGTCTLKCDVGLACNAATDCASNFCHATTKRCVATQCEDAVKGTDESDVDCGGASSCARCGQGKACGSTLDCASGLTCDGNVCRQGFVLSVAVTGLPAAGTLELTNATTGDVLTFTAAGTQPFASRITGPYAVTITSQPFNASCALVGGTGTATADLTLQVNCSPRYAIGGTLTGLLAGNTVTLTNNGADALTLNADGSFAFPTRVAAAYAVAIQSQPAGQNCAVTNGSGTATADVTTVTVTCSSGFAIGGNLSGLPAGRAVTLTNNGGNALTLMANGPFTFTNTSVAYDVQVSSQPSGATCRVTNGTGTATGPVTNVQVTCLGSGTLDTTFNGQGWMTQAPNGFHNEWFRMVLNPDDSQVWVGRDQVGGADEDWVISKLTPNGTFDATFGTNGHLRIARGAVLGESARAIHRNADGTYLVAGTIFDTGSFSFAVARVTAAGALDTTFGTNGLVIHDFANAQEYLKDMKVLADGSMVLVGHRDTGTNADLQVLKLTAAGALDTAFATGGRYLLATAGVEEVATAVDVNPNTQDIFVVGWSGPDSLVVAMQGNGFASPLFGTAGVRVFDASGANQADGLHAVVVTGSVLTAVGWAQPGTNQDFLVAQMSSIDAMPTTFGGTGQVLIDRGGNNDVLRSIVYNPATGGFYVAGTSNLLLALLKFTSGGTLDTTFATNGQFAATLASSGIGNDVDIDSQGRICTGGAISGPNPDFGAARFNP